MERPAGPDWNWTSSRELETSGARDAGRTRTRTEARAAALYPASLQERGGAAPGYQLFESRCSAVLPAATDREAVSLLPCPSVSDRPRWPRKDQKHKPSTYSETGQNFTEGAFLLSFQSRQRGRGLSRRLAFSGDAVTADTPVPGRPCPASQPHSIWL